MVYLMTMQRLVFTLQHNSCFLYTISVRVSVFYELTKEGEQEQDDEDNLYRDVNINLKRSDAEMTDAQANKDTKDAHVTLTVVPPIVQ
ncbi:hypothetical protein Tco_1206189 [Tanacetum coccineum]